MPPPPPIAPPTSQQLLDAQLALYNGALVNVLGERALASLTEERAPRRYLDQAWNNNAVDKLLMQGQWKFARRTVRMDTDTSITPNFGWTYGFERPFDYIRALDICQDEFFQVPLERYAEERTQPDGWVFFAVITPFYMGYVSNDIAWGGDLTTWPVNFEAFAEHWLALQILASLTGNKTDRVDLEKLTAQKLTRAQNTDAMEGPTKFAPVGTWVQARMGGRVGGWDRGSRARLIG